VPDEVPTPEAPAWSPEQTVQQVKAWGSKLQLDSDGDRIMIRGHQPAWLEKDLQDPEKYGALHAHLAEIAHQRADADRKQAVANSLNDALAAAAYGSPGSGYSGHGLPWELAQLEQEVARRTTAVEGEIKRRKATKK
jgi:hypothetical protein